MKTNSNNSEKPKMSEVVSSAIVKIYESTLDFIDKMSQRWDKGDRLGAIIQALILMEVLFFGMFIGLVLAHIIPTVHAEKCLNMIPIIMGVLFVVIIFAALLRVPADNRLANGQEMRVSAIQPKSIYEGVQKKT